MAVEVKSQRDAVVIGWDPKGAGTDTGGEQPEAPDGFPTHPIFLPGSPEHPIVLPPPSSGGEPSHPIYLPPYVDIGFPEDQPRPDQGLPGDQPRPDQGLPGDQPKPDQGLPGDQPRPDQGLPETPPDSGAHPSHPIRLPDYAPPPGGSVPTPQKGKGGAIRAVQVFGQGQDGDWSNTAIMPNDGEAALHYPKGFTGESYVEVRGLDGTLVDSGTITVG
jgi:hypothetical protein